MRGRGLSPSILPSEAQSSLPFPMPPSGRSPESRPKPHVTHSKSTRKYPGGEVMTAVDGRFMREIGMRKESPINIRTYKLVPKPESPERCRGCRNTHCTCKTVEPKRLLSSKTSRTSTQSPVRRSSKQSESRLGKTPDCTEAMEGDSDEAVAEAFSPDSSFEVDTSLPDAGEVRHLQLPSISQSIATPSLKLPKLLRSIYVGRPATILFDYPPQCLQPSRLTARVLDMDPEEAEHCPLTFRVSDSIHTYNCFVNAYLFNGFTQTTSGGFNILMSSPPKPEFLLGFNAFQRVNHFPGSWQIGRKDNLWRNVSRLRRRFGRDYEICPNTYILPEDFKRFEAEREDDAKAYWIRKPVASSCGRGIKVVSSSQPIKNKQYPPPSGYLYSRYISNPHLINGLKYDLRVYVVVTCFDPLRIYVFEEGLVRFATEQYKLNKRTIKKRYTHLTNYSVNKAAARYQANVNPSVSRR